MNNNHFSNGGTGITNFSPKQLPIYQEAIRRSGYSGVLEVQYRPMAGNPHAFPSDYSLHYVSKDTASLNVPWGLSPFWRVFEKVQKEFESRPVAQAVPQACRCEEQAFEDLLLFLLTVRIFEVRTFTYETVVMVSDGFTTYIEYRLETVIFVREVRLF